MRLVVVGGGTATNQLVTMFQTVADQVDYVMPISDNGGSTSEIIRVLGGPAIGDVRSRITRLIDAHVELKQLFSLRLNAHSARAKAEWLEIVEGTHACWHSAASPQKELIRAFFVHVHSELLKRTRPGRSFNFANASVGNLFLTGARLFCGSLDSAIELLMRICHVSTRFSVLPAINSNFTHHIAAVLENGDVVTGQSQISHPSRAPASPPPPHEHEDAHPPFSHPALTSSQLHFDKHEPDPLAARVARVFYINAYGHEIHPHASSRVLAALAAADALVFSIGSLYTSIVPVVLLRGFFHALLDNPRAKRVLLVNGSTDRETHGMRVPDFVRALAQAAHTSLAGTPHAHSLPPAVTHVVTLSGSPVSAPQMPRVSWHEARMAGPGEYDLHDLGRVLQHILRST